LVEDEASAGQQNVQLKELDSPLRSAVTASHPELVQRLLRGRADVNGKDTRGVTPLHLAVFKGRQHIVNMLLSAAADANARDCHGQSPIFFAPSRQICETLMARSADLGLVNIRNQTPLHLLARAGLHDAAACVLEVLQAPVLELEDEVQPAARAVMLPASVWRGLQWSHAAATCSAFQSSVMTSALAVGCFSKLRDCNGNQLSLDIRRVDEFHKLHMLWRDIGHGGHQEDDGPPATKREISNCARADG